MPNEEGVDVDLERGPVRDRESTVDLLDERRRDRPADLEERPADCGEWIVRFWPGPIGQLAARWTGRFQEEERQQRPRLATGQPAALPVGLDEGTPEELDPDRHPGEVYVFVASLAPFAFDCFSFLGAFAFARRWVLLLVDSGSTARVIRKVKVGPRLASPFAGSPVQSMWRYWMKPGRSASVS